MRSRVGYTSFIILTPPAILSVILLLWLAAQFQHTWAHLPQVLEAQLTAALGREVRIGQIKGNYWTGLEVHDLAVARSDKLSNGVLARVTRARVRYSLDAVLHQGVPPLEAIERIELERPWLFVSRDRKGRFNLQEIAEELSKPSKPPKEARPQRFLATVAIRNGTVVFEDHQVRGGPLTHHLTGIDVDFDGRAFPLYAVSLRARGDTGRLASVAVHATVDPERQAYSVLADLQGVQIKPWLAYVPAQVKLPVTPEGGLVDARVSALIEAGKLADYHGRVKVRDAALRVPQLSQPVSDLDGTFQVSPDVVTADDLRITAGKLRLSGTATVSGFQKPWVRAQLMATGIEEADVRELVPGLPPLPDVRLGRIDNVRVSVAGPVTAPSATVGFDLTSVTRPEATLSDLHVEARVAGLKQLEIDTVTAKVAGGTVSARGSLHLEGKEPRYAFRGALRGIRLDEINLRERLGENAPSGTVSADFEASGVGAAPKVHARVDVTDAGWKEWQVTAVQADCTYGDGRVEVHGAHARTPEALLTAHGSIQLEGGIQLQVAATEVDVTALARRFNVEKLRGEAHVRGEVTGTLSEPSFQGELAAYNLAYGDDRLEMLRANVQGDLNQVRIEECRGLYLPAQLGGVEVTLHNPRAGAEAEIEATGAVVGIDLGRLCKRFNLEGDWGGIVDVEELAITGPLNDLRIEAFLTARDLRGAGYGIDYVSGRVVAGIDGAVEVPQEDPVTVRTGESEVQLWGTLSAERQLDLMVATAEGKSLRVEDIHAFDPSVVALKSRLGMELHVTGPVTAPQIKDGDLRVHELVVNGNTFGPGSGKVHISKESVRVDHFVLIGGQKDAEAGRREQYEVNGTVWPREDLDITAAVVAAPIAKLMDLGRVPPPPFPVEGRLTALIKVKEGEPRPLVSVTRLDVTDGRVGPQPVETLTVEGIELNKDDLVVSKLTVALPGGTTLMGEGRASLAANGPIQFNVDAEEIDLALVQPWVSLGQEIGGTGKLHLQVSGTLNEPVVVGRVDARSPRYGNFQIDAIGADLSFRDHVARVTNLLVEKAGYSASGYAELPVDWEEKRVAPDAAIRAQVRVDKQSLNALTLFTPRIVEISKDGYASAILDVGGTLADPKLNGSVEVQCNALVVGNPRPGGEPERALMLRGLDAVLRVEDERIVIEHVNVASAAKPKELEESGTLGKLLRALRASRGATTDRGKAGGEPEALKTPEALQLTGTISLNRFLPDQFDLKLVAKEFEFWERNLSGRFQEELAFRLNGAVAIRDRWPSPLVSGALELQRARVDVQKYQAPKEVPPPREPLAINPRFALTVKSREAEVLAARTKAYANASLAIRGSLNEPQIEEGSVDLIRGGVNVSTAYFRIKEGEVAFEMDPRHGLSALGQIELATHLRGKNPRTGKEESFAVEAHVAIDMPNAPEEQVQVEFEATPYLENDQVWSLLMRKDVLEGIVAGRTDASVEDALKREAANLVATALQPSLVEPVERAVAEMLGLNEFSIRASFEEPVEVQVGKHLVKGLRVSYTRAVSAREARYTFKVDYEVLNGVSFSWMTDQQSNRTLGLEAGFQF